MEQALRDLLLAAALAGDITPATMEVSWLEHPQGVARPGIVLTPVSGTEPYAQDGPIGLQQATVQVDIYADDRDQAAAIAGQVRAVLSGYRGPGTGGRFEGIFLTATRAGRETGTNEAERPWRRSMDFDLNWRVT